MSTDGSGKPCPRDNNPPFDLYSALFQPESQLDNGRSSSRMLLPNVPILHQYRQQFIQYPQETLQFVPDQSVQSTPQENHPTSGHQNQHFAQLLISGQSFPQDQNLVTSQLGQISPNAHYLMSNRLDQTSLPAQHTMPSQPNQISSHSPQFMSNQPNEVSPNAQYLMSSQSDETSPPVQNMMSSQSNQISPHSQQFVSCQPNEVSPNVHYLMSSPSDDMSPPAQHMMSSQSDEMSPHSEQFMSSQSDHMSPQSQQFMSSQSDHMSPQSQQLMSSQSDHMSHHSQQLISRQPDQMSLLAQQLILRQPNQTSLQLSGGRAIYPQNTPHLQQSVQRVTVNLDSPSFVLDQLCLKDSASALLRPDLLATGESLIQQREYDLNIFSAAGNSSRNQSQNVFPNSFSAPKNFDAFMPEQGSPNLMLENLLTKNSRSTRNVTPPVITSASMGHHHFVLNPSSSCHDMPSTSKFYTVPLSTNDASLPGPSMNAMMHTGQFQLKLERQDFNTTPAGNSNAQESSLWRNQPSEHFSPDRFTTGRKFVASSSSVQSVPLVNSNTGNASVISPERRAPKRSYDQSSMEPQHRQAPECSTLSAAASSGATSSDTASSGSASLEETVEAPTNSETNKNGEIATAGDSNDPSYLEKRRKNNESAKKSREVRRLKEKTNFSAVFDYHKQITECSTFLHVLKDENIRLRQNLGILEGFDEQRPPRPGLFQFVPQPPNFDKQDHF